MQPKVQRSAAGTDEPAPVCLNSAGDGSAAPTRRFLELVKEFGENGLVTSICEPSYAPLLQVLIEKIAAQLQAQATAR